MKKIRRIRFSITVLSLVIIAVACGGGDDDASGDTQADSSETTTSTAVATGEGCAAYSDDFSLTVGLSEAGEAIAAEFATLAADFDAAHENVTVEVQSKDFASSLQTIRLAMSGDNPPDVMQGNSGWAINGALWEAGLIANLDPYAEQYGWFDEFPESALTVNRFSADAQTLGVGNLVGLPQAIQYVGVFYNKDMLADLGITDPSVLDDRDTFMQVIEDAKAAGITPVMLGDSDKWPALHNLSLFNGWYVTPDEINAWVYNTEGTTYDNEGRLQGSTDFQNWMTNGYFNSDALATSFSDATARFGQGESVFFITGTWALGDVSGSLGDSAGFMLFPSGEAGKHAAVGGYSLPWTISSKSAHPDCAAEFLDYITASPEAIAAQIAAGRPSATLAGADAQIDDPLLAQMVSEYQRLSADNGLFTWEDWPTPTMLEFMGSEAQLLLGGQTSPQEYNSAVQENWDDFMASR